MGEAKKVCKLCGGNLLRGAIRLPGDIYICKKCIKNIQLDTKDAKLSYNDLSEYFEFLAPVNKDSDDTSKTDLTESTIDTTVENKRNKKKSSHSNDNDLDKRLMPPHKIKEKLDQYVVGQEQAKKILSVAAYNHYKRIFSTTDSTLSKGVEIEKSNILMMGPTGTGKTYLVKSLAKILTVPVAIADATALTSSGYVGDDVESVISKLFAVANNNKQKAELGIIFIDEIDKIASTKSEGNSKDVNGEAVQQALLKLLEGTTIEAPVGSTNKRNMFSSEGQTVTIDTSNILFICGGAFPRLNDIIKERLNKKSSIGFYNAINRHKQTDNLLDNVTIADLCKFGMIPEFLGRVPIIVTLEKLTKEMLVKILKEPKNAILKQYEALLAMNHVELVFEDEALELIAEKALEKEIGARAVRSVIEKFMLDIMFEVPKNKQIKRVIVTKDYINRIGDPIYEMNETSLSAT